MGFGHASFTLCRHHVLPMGLDACLLPEKRQSYGTQGVYQLFERDEGILEDIVKWKNIGETMWIVIMCVMAPFFVTLLLVTGNLVVEFMDPYVQLSLSLSIYKSLSIYLSIS